MTSTTDPPVGRRTRRLPPLRIVVVIVFTIVGVGGFILPGLTLLSAFFDPALNGPGIPRLARRIHLSLTPRHAKWAQKRLQSGSAAKLSIANAAGTEWPLYGSVFYLRAEEAMEAGWEHDHSICAQEPRIYAHDAIEAAARLVADPGQAAWVHKYWGDRYLEKEDLFYRMLVISALASHRHLTGSDEFLPLLRSQTDLLASEIDASSFGLLDDYPGQCFPTDVISAWDAIRRADAALGADHSREIAKALRAFSGKSLGALGLPSYVVATARSGEPADDSRGSTNSNACMLAAELWPANASAWYAAYERHFWQQDWLAAGFREFPPGTKGGEWYLDVDSGPVVEGYGFAACGFGVAAARSQGRFDHAYALSLEMIALSWPLPDGRLVLPRVVSDAENAPYLGEAAILFALTRQPTDAPIRRHSGPVPGIVFLCLAGYLGLGAPLLNGAIRRVWPAAWRRSAG